MPNWVYSGFNVTGPPTEIARFKHMMFKPVSDPASAAVQGSLQKTMMLDFGGILPMPVGEEDVENWAVDNWGVKWNALDLDCNLRDRDTVWFQFTTPWDFPTPVFEALASEFPSLIFAGSSYEESGDFELVGEFNGENDWGPGQIQWLGSGPIDVGGAI
ncbi:hypothetical protein JW805_14100 [Roseomonas aeriglobus]|nr:hypothetical protein [Roseomonas aeriglobus]